MVRSITTRRRHYVLATQDATSLRFGHRKSGHFRLLACWPFALLITNRSYLRGK